MSRRTMLLMADVLAPPERERRLAPCGSQRVEYDFYKGKGVHTTGSPFLFVLLHGWLGSETLHMAAQAVAWHGHDVAVPVHDHSFHVRNFLQPNKRRSQDAHAVTKHASALTGKKDIIVLDHSNGNQDALHLAEHTARTPQDYRIHAVGAIAGVGMNGRHVSPLSVISESIEHAKLLARHPKEDLQVLGRSALNFLRNPLLAVEEGIVASVVACRHAFTALQQEDVIGSVFEVYLDKDTLIPPPADGSGIVLPGSHMTPVVEPEVMTFVADSLSK